MVKLIREPQVYLVCVPTINDGELARFFEAEGYGSRVDPNLVSYRQSASEGTAVVEIAARLCYASYGRGRTDIAAFIGNILSSKHGSVLEHANYGFIITGVSRSLTHEAVRHRAGFAYSQRSQRYVDESEARVVVPPIFLELGEVPLFEGAVASLEASYALLFEGLDVKVTKEGVSTTERRKALRQAARSVLPNATETQYYVTGNVRAWRHFIELRASVHADDEIQRLAKVIHGKLAAESPLLFGDFTEDEQGSLVPLYSKV